jgi:MFS family permease
MHENELHHTPTTPRSSGQIRAGLAYVWSVPKLKTTLIMMFIIGTFANEFAVILPLFATITMHGNAGTYSAMMGAIGLGAILGGLYTAGKAEVREKQLISAAVLFGVSILVTAAMPTLAAAIVVLVLVGACSVLFVALGNTTLQLTSDPAMRGRVMSLWSIGFSGTTPIGGPLIGFISDHSNPRIGLAVGGLSAVIAGLIGLYIFRHSSKSLSVGLNR